MSEKNATSECSVLPRLSEIGRDLLEISWSRTVIVVVTPLACAAAYVAFALLGWWPLAIIAVMALSFSTYGSTSHELVHRNLRLPRWLNEGLLSLLELLALRSGHAYRFSHLHHHARFPNDDDIEGTAARKTLASTLLFGLTLQWRICLWSFIRDEPNRHWIAMEGVAIIGLIALAIIVVVSAPWLLVFVVLMFLGHAVLPVATVWFVHDAKGAHRLLQTRAFRGRLASIIGLQHLYHLEHHLYPRVPHPNWPELARRLDPFLIAAGVPLRRL